MAKTSIPLNPSGAYVYEIVVDGVVRYIGKGTGRRLHRHLRVARRVVQRRADGETFWVRRFYNQLAKAIVGGAAIEARCRSEGLADADAFELERRLICESDRSQLWNETDGGDGSTSEYAKRLWADPNFREKHRIAHKAATSTKEFSVKATRQLLARWKDPEVRKAASAAKKEEYASRADHSFKRPRTPDDLARNRESRKTEWSDAEYRARQMNSRRARWEKPDQKIKASIAMSGVWSDAERRARMGNTIREKWLDPDYRASMMAARAAKRLR